MNHLKLVRYVNKQYVACNFLLSHLSISILRLLKPKPGYLQFVERQDAATR